MSETFILTYFKYKYTTQILTNSINTQINLTPGIHGNTFPIDSQIMIYIKPPTAHEVLQSLEDLQIRIYNMTLPDTHKHPQLPNCQKQGCNFLISLNTDTELQQATNAHICNSHYKHTHTVLSQPQNTNINYLKPHTHLQWCVIKQSLNNLNQHSLKKCGDIYHIINFKDIMDVCT